MITIFVGDISEELRLKSIKFDKSATLITIYNYQKLNKGTYFISLGDIVDLQLFYKILDLADTIIYSPPAKWSDDKDSSSYMKLWTEFFVLYFRNRKNVLGIEHITKGNLSMQLSDIRKSDKSQLWIAGCSVSHGMGVEDKERYGSIIADKLQLPVSFLTAPGASNEWASEQIIMSDIRKGDIVILGLTAFGRFVYYSDKVQHINSSAYEQFPELRKIFNIEILDSPFLKYKSISHIHQVLNFCKKIDCKLIIAGLLINEHDLFYLKSIPNYIQLLGSKGLGSERFIDIGSDNSHPGPLSHKWYADQILQKINNLL